MFGGLGALPDVAVAERVFVKVESKEKGGGKMTPRTILAVWNEQASDITGYQQLFKLAKASA